MGRETYIDGGEYAQRVATRQRVVLGFQQAMWLEEHQASFPQLMDLLDKIEIHFTGIVLIYSEKLTRVHLVRGGDGLLIRKNPENDRWVLRTTLLNFCHTTKGGGQNHGKNIAHCIALA